MAAAVFPALLRRWRVGVQPGGALRRLVRGLSMEPGAEGWV